MSEHASRQPAWLIVRLGALGDIVHALPLAAALRAASPGARIDWLVDVRHRAILDRVDGLSTILPIDTRRMRGATGVPAVVRALRAARYDVAIDAQGLVKSALLARLAGAGRVLGFDRAHLREPLARWMYDGTAAPAGPHVLDKAAALAAALGAQASPPRFALRPPASDVAARARAVLGVAADRPFAALNPGAAWPNKRWPADRFGALAQHLHARHGWASIVTWGPGEESLAAAVVAAANAGGGDAVAAAAPPTDLGELLALLAAAGLVVAGDTGPLHLAGALGTPVVGLYGPTDPARNGPWSPADVTVSRTAACRCAYARRCHATRWCLEDVAVAEVAAAVDRRLAIGDRGRGLPPGREAMA
jgi:lipopolysaccharide heptosyltransferase I